MLLTICILRIIASNQTVEYMTHWGARATYLSANTNTYTGQNTLFNHLDKSVLYAMVAVRRFFNQSRD